jgi:hypothetical protein
MPAKKSSKSTHASAKHNEDPNPKTIEQLLEDDPSLDGTLLTADRNYANDPSSPNDQFLLNQEYLEDTPDNELVTPPIPEGPNS